MNGGKASTSKVAEVVCHLTLPTATSFPAPRGAALLTQADAPTAYSQASITPSLPNISKGHLPFLVAFHKGIAWISTLMKLQDT